MVVEKISKYLSAKYIFSKKKFIVTNFSKLFSQRDANFFYGLSEKSKIHVFRNSKSIFIFHFWTFIFVHFSLFKNNLGFSKNVTFYIINPQSNLKNFIYCCYLCNFSYYFIFLFFIIITFASKSLNY